MRVIDFFDNGANGYPDNLAFVDEQSQYTYKEAQAHSHFIASTLAAKGYEAGTRIGILSPNSCEAFVTLLGLFRSGAVWLPINPRNALDANIKLLNRFEGKVLFYHTAFEKEAFEIQQNTATIEEIVCINDTGDDRVLAQWTSANQTDFVMQAEDPNELFALFPTGGTTGEPKGVMLTHRNIEVLFANFFAHFSYQDNDAHLVVAPMTHTAGILGCAHFPRGGTNYIMGAPDPVSVLKMIEKHSITHFFIPPTVLYMILAQPCVNDFDYSSLKHIMVGAAPTSLEKLKEAIGVFGPVLSEAFGQTEAPAAITAKAPWDYIDKDGNIIESRLKSIGRPCIFNTVAILDDNGKSVPNGERGEICVKGDLVTPGYLNNEAATKEVREFGWHHTGDIGVMDKDGFIMIVDRKKDMIITGGFNVYPNQVEQALMEFSEIQDCAVIGVPDEKWGESVKGVIQLKSGKTLLEVDVIAVLKEKLGSVKAPKSIDFVEQLPRSPVGKVLKVELRKPYWANAGRSVN